MHLLLTLKYDTSTIENNYIIKKKAYV